MTINNETSRYIFAMIKESPINRLKGDYVSLLTSVQWSYNYYSHDIKLAQSAVRESYYEYFGEELAGFSCCTSIVFLFSLLRLQHFMASSAGRVSLWYGHIALCRNCVELFSMKPYKIRWLFYLFVFIFLTVEIFIKMVRLKYGTKLGETNMISHFLHLFQLTLSRIYNIYCEIWTKIEMETIKLAFKFICVLG